MNTAINREHFQVGDPVMFGVGLLGLLGAPPMARGLLRARSVWCRPGGRR